MNRSLKRLALIVAVAVSATAAHAQQNDPSVQSPNLENLSAKQPILEYALAGGFLLGALAIGFKPANRSKENA